MVMLNQIWASKWTHGFKTVFGFSHRHMVSTTVKRNQIRWLKSATLWDYIPAMSIPTWKAVNGELAIKIPYKSKVKREATIVCGRLPASDSYPSLPDSISRMRYSEIHREEPVRIKIMCHFLKKRGKNPTVKVQVMRIKVEKLFSTSCECKQMEEHYHHFFRVFRKLESFCWAECFVEVNGGVQTNQMFFCLMIQTY